MAAKPATLLAWSLFGVFAALAAGTVVLVLRGEADSDQLFVVLCTGFALVGALVAVREPRNAVGWLLLSIALSFAFTFLADSYIARAGRPFEVTVAWLDNWVWYLRLYLAVTALPLVFPDGRLLSPRWRLAMWTGVVALVLGIVSAVLKDGPLPVEAPGDIPNPTGVGGAATWWISSAGVLSNALAAVGFLLGGASLLVRLRRSHGRAREQVKWFAYVAALAVGGLTLALTDVFNETVGGTPTPGWSQVIGTFGWVVSLLTVVVGLPAAIGMAILRHRLYDIDVVIKRTLVYGSLTLLLAATYLALVLGLRVALSPVTGDSDLAVAASTLAVAGLFRPGRSRIQGVVDRRFFRPRYDASRTLDDFAGHLRHELDLETLGTDLREVVATTMQPTHVTLWLTASARSRRHPR
jgi:hypothetical protein